ncbi:GGDEF domain-containing protein [Devosia sp. A449]
MVTLIAATVSISISTGVRVILGIHADTVTVAVRILLPFVIAIPFALLWFSRLEQLEIAYRDLLKQTAELIECASTDPLTGVLNRRSFVEHFDLAQARGAAGFLLIVDVDYLKAVNDRFGHLVGDAAIMATATALREALGSGAFIARIGGDEFCAFLPTEIAPDLTGLTSQMNAISTREFRARTGLDEDLTVSLGYHSCGRGQSFEATMSRADQMLFGSKHARRLGGL